MRISDVILYDTFASNDPRRKLFSDLFRLAKTKKEIDLTPGKQQIDLLHIDDICRGFGQLVIQSPAKNLPLGHIFDVAICRQSNNTLIEIIEKFNELSPQKLMCNFGARAYSPYDSFKLNYPVPVLPNWTPSLDLEASLSKLFQD